MPVRLVYQRFLNESYSVFFGSNCQFSTWAEGAAGSVDRRSAIMLAYGRKKTKSCRTAGLRFDTKANCAAVAEVRRRQAR